MVSFPALSFPFDPPNVTFGLAQLSAPGLLAGGLLFQQQIPSSSDVPVPAGSSRTVAGQQLQLFPMFIIKLVKGQFLV